MGINRSLVRQAIIRHLWKWLDVLRKGKVRVALRAVVHKEKIRLIIKSMDDRTFRSQLILPGLPVQIYLFKYREFEERELLATQHSPIRL